MKNVNLMFFLLGGGGDKVCFPNYVGKTGGKECLLQINQAGLLDMG